MCAAAEGTNLRRALDLEGCVYPHSRRHFAEPCGRGSIEAKEEIDNDPLSEHGARVRRLWLRGEMAQRTAARFALDPSAGADVEADRRTRSGSTGSGKAGGAGRSPADAGGDLVQQAIGYGLFGVAAN